MLIELDDAKAHLNITGNDDDNLITEKIRVADQWIEKFTGKALADYGNATPAPLREAARQIVGHLYENREATLIGVSGEELPFGVCDLLAPYREYVF